MKWEEIWKLKNPAERKQFLIENRNGTETTFFGRTTM
jgi:hypothetical protein